MNTRIKERSLLSVVGKMYGMILINHAQKITDNMISEISKVVLDLAEDV